jgi:hypothetical protein
LPCPLTVDDDDGDGADDDYDDVLGDGWRRFAKGGDRAVFEHFWVTNSVPTVTDGLPKDDSFVVLDLMDKVCVCVCACVRVRVHEGHRRHA